MVLDDPAAAAAATAGGVDVVLILPEEAPGGADGAAGPAAGPGRWAVLVGDAADPAVRRAAEEMDAELFGAVTSRR